MTKITTGVISTFFCPLTTWQLDLVDLILSKHKTVTFAVQAKVESSVDSNWPNFLPNEGKYCLSYWERFEIIRNAIHDKYPSDVHRIIIVPLFVCDSSFSCSDSYLPSLRTWYFIKGDSNWLANKIAQKGENIQLLQKPINYINELNLLQKLYEKSDHQNYLCKTTLDYLNKIYFELRLNDFFSNKKMTKGQKGGSMAGISFSEKVEVHGDIINIEGNQYNLATEPKEEVYRIIQRITLNGINSDNIVAVVNQLNEKISDRNDLVKNDIAIAVNETLSANITSDSGKGKVETALEKLTYGASGSLLASAIIQGIKLFLGMP